MCSNLAHLAGSLKQSHNCVLYYHTITMQLKVENESLRT